MLDKERLKITEPVNHFLRRLESTKQLTEQVVLFAIMELIDIRHSPAENNLKVEESYFFDKDQKFVATHWHYITPA